MVLHRIRLSYDALAEGKKRGAMPEEMLKELGRTNVKAASASLPKQPHPLSSSYANSDTPSALRRAAHRPRRTV